MCCGICEKKRGHVKSVCKGIKASSQQGIKRLSQSLARSLHARMPASLLAASRRVVAMLSAAAILWTGSTGCSTGNVVSWKPTRIPKPQPAATQPDLMDELDLAPPRTIWCLLPTGRTNEYRWVEIQQ
jgi:hypothetical protein